jgi:2-oxoglutarate/2-oxoacid ferredoxin oxidoreductase subunit alpha
MLEPVELPEKVDANVSAKPWATTGAMGRKRNFITTLYMEPEELERVNLEIQAKYTEICRSEARYDEYRAEDADVILVAYGCTARVCLTTMYMARDKGLKVGLFRPTTLFPFPAERLRELASSGKRFLVVEMSAGQMVEDVRLAVNGATCVDFYGRIGGIVPSPAEILEQVKLPLL